MGWLDRLRAAAAPEVPVSEAGMAAALEAAGRGDYATALAIWEPLAQAGVARAQNNIGACFAEGLGVERDPDLAFALAGARRRRPATRSASAISPRSISSGEGVEQDYGRAAALYRAAAEAGRCGRRRTC